MKNSITGILGMFVLTNILNFTIRQCTVSLERLNGQVSGCQKFEPALKVSGDPRSAPRLKVGGVRVLNHGNKNVQMLGYGNEQKKHLENYAIIMQHSFKDLKSPMRNRKKIFDFNFQELRIN